MSIRSLIIDDEPLAIEVIKNHINQISEIELIEVFQNPVKAFEFLKENTVDLIFLDIEMPLLTGVEFLKSVQNPPKVIFTTAHRDYAVMSYELDVIDYLLKPISFPRLFKAVNKYKAFQKGNEIEIQNSASIIQQDHIYVNSNKKFIKILFEQIIYVESIKDYVRIHFKDRTVMTKDTIGSFLMKLPNEFLRIHRSFVVNTTKVTAFTALDVEINRLELPIGSSYKADVIRFLKD